MDVSRQSLATPREQVARLPLGPGVYRFRDAAGRVLYLGRAGCLRRRVASYWGDLGDRSHLAVMVACVARVEAVPCASALEAAWLERNLLAGGVPPWNRSGGQESEVWIRLSPSGRTPGVAVIRRPGRGDPARYFGPYLGGRKARDAVSGLRRVLPLGHATNQPAGTARELARARSASAPARTYPVPALSAVLDRDPAAVAALRAELIRRRDAAAARLAFEFAGQVQAELEALDWITAEQMVTSAQLCDFDVYGWAGGVLVRFEVRGGRLSGWSQCAAGPPPPAATWRRPRPVRNGRTLPPGPPSWRRSWPADLRQCADAAGFIVPRSARRNRRLASLVGQRTAANSI